MEENKYYTPSFEEFHHRFEYEALNSNDWFFAESEYGWKKMQWEPTIGTLNQGVYEIIGIEGVQTPPQNQGGDLVEP